MFGVSRLTILTSFSSKHIIVLLVCRWVKVVDEASIHSHRNEDIIEAHVHPSHRTLEHYSRQRRQEPRRRSRQEHHNSTVACSIRLPVPQYSTTFGGFLTLSPCLVLTTTLLTGVGNDQPKHQNPAALGSSSGSSGGGRVGVGAGPGGADGPGTLSKEPVWRDSDNSDSGSGGGGGGGGGGKGGRWADFRVPSVVAAVCVEQVLGAGSE